MATAHRIAAPTAPDDAIVVQLDGDSYRLRYRWNSRVSRWMIDLRTIDDQPILAGATLLMDRPLLGQNDHADRPPGELIAGDPSGNRNPPGLYDLGVRAYLYYVSA